MQKPIRANQLSGFYVIGTSVMKELNAVQLSLILFCSTLRRKQMNHIVQPVDYNQTSLHVKDLVDIRSVLRSLSIIYDGTFFAETVNNQPLDMRPFTEVFTKTIL